MTLLDFGIACMGFMMGYILYYAVRHTNTFDGTLLSAIAGLIGGGAVPAYFLKNDTTSASMNSIFGFYGCGLAAGFVVYLFLAFLIANYFKEKKFLSSALLGVNFESTP